MISGNLLRNNDIVLFKQAVLKQEILREDSVQRREDFPLKVTSPCLVNTTLDDHLGMKILAEPLNFVL